MRARFVGCVWSGLPLCPAAAMARGIRYHPRGAWHRGRPVLQMGCAELNNLAHAHKVSPALPLRNAVFPIALRRRMRCPQIVAGTRATKRRYCGFQAAASAPPPCPPFAQSARAKTLRTDTGAPGQRARASQARNSGGQAVMSLACGSRVRGLARRCVRRLRPLMRPRPCATAGTGLASLAGCPAPVPVLRATGRHPAWLLARPSPSRCR